MKPITNRELTLYIMVGIPGSGKTYIAKNTLMKIDSRHTTYVSRDEIRERTLLENDDYFAREKEVFRQFVKRINYELGRGYSVIADATHINEKSRMNLINNIYLQQDINIIFVVCNTPLHICNERNSCREGFAKIPEKAILDMSTRFTKPTQKEWSKYEKKVNSVKSIEIKGGLR